jgi:hypothetical protein
VDDDHRNRRQSVIIEPANLRKAGERIERVGQDSLGCSSALQTIAITTETNTGVQNHFNKLRPEALEERTAAASDKIQTGIVPPAHIRA